MDVTARHRESGGHGVDGRLFASRAAMRHDRDRGVSVGCSGAPLRDATVRDASAHGCRIDCDAGWLRVGAFISIRSDETCNVMGIVRWVRGAAAGVEFLQPLLPGSPAWHHLFGSAD